MTGGADRPSARRVASGSPTTGLDRGRTGPLPPLAGTGGDGRQPRTSAEIAEAGAFSALLSLFVLGLRAQWRSGRLDSEAAMSSLDRAINRLSSLGG